MKFAITLVALFCVSAISAAPTKELSPFVQGIIALVKGVVNQLERQVPDWDPKATLEDNISAYAGKPIFVDFIPGWNPEASIQDNLLNAVQNYYRSLESQGLDEKKSIAENVKIIIADLFERLPIPSFFPKEPIEQIITNNFLEALKRAKGSEGNKTNDDGFNPNATLGDLVDVGPENLLVQGMYPGFSNNKTLEDNIAVVLESLLKKLPL